MRSKYFGKFLGAFVAVALLMGLMPAPALSQVETTGKTEEQASQLILYYSTFDDFGPDRQTTVQITNASVDTPVWVHIQIFATTLVSWCSPIVFDRCAEHDFIDFFTPQDTHIYMMSDDFLDFERNDPLNPGSIGINVDGTKGFVVVTPIDAPGTRNAIAHQHMFGTSGLFTSDGPSFGARLNSQGRDAVNLSTGAILADGTLLDGTTNGFVLIQPNFLKFNFWTDEENDIANLISISFRDDYEGVFGYGAVPGDATWTPLIFDENENPVSCSPHPQDCFFAVGINDEIGNRLEQECDQLRDELCPNSDSDRGWMKIAVSGLDGGESEFGITEFFTNAFGPMSGIGWMVTE